MGILLKHCSKCYDSKPETDFYKQSATKDGLQYYCKSCASNHGRLKKWYPRDPVKRRESELKWRLENPEKYKAKCRRKELKRRKNPIRKIKKNMRKRIKNLLINPDNQSFSIGCTGAQLRQHIEAQFKDGMTWDNYGLWHIDHIVPLSKFNLSTREERCRANHYTNLQPLWAQENIKKSNR